MRDNVRCLFRTVFARVHLILAETEMLCFQFFDFPISVRHLCRRGVAAHINSYGYRFHATGGAVVMNCTKSMEEKKDRVISWCWRYVLSSVGYVLSYFEFEVVVFRFKGFCAIRFLPDLPISSSTSRMFTFVSMYSILSITCFPCLQRVLYFHEWANAFAFQFRCASVVTAVLCCSSSWPLFFWTSWRSQNAPVLTPRMMLLKA